MLLCYFVNSNNNIFKGAACYSKQSLFLQSQVASFDRIKILVALAEILSIVFQNIWKLFREISSTLIQ